MNQRRTEGPYSTCAVDSLRVAIVSDTHSALDERIAEEITASHAVVHGGDVGSAAVLNALHDRCRRVTVVRGNNDVPTKWRREEVECLERLPREATLELPGGVLVVVHGDRAGRPKTRHAWLRAAYPHARAVVYGHSHHLCVDTEAEPWILNPGAAGRSRTYGGPSCLILFASPTEWRVEIRRFGRQGQVERCLGPHR